MIQLGAFDATVAQTDLQKYLTHANSLTGVTDQQDWKEKLRGEGRDKNGRGIWVKFSPLSDGEMKVAEMQKLLKDAGFFPSGRIDGICGYRTLSAVRLFQEYVRTVEGDTSLGFPDGRFGPKSAAHLRRWAASGKRADWAEFSSTQPSPEYALWLDLLNRFKETYTARPTTTLQKVNAFAGKTKTLKPGQWDLAPEHIHLIGIRRNKNATAKQPLDDIFVLLINGIVFKFRGSTDPGSSENAKGMPFLVPGQHLYRFGWHLLAPKRRKDVYQALKPLEPGVLVARSTDTTLTDADVARGLECNNTINVHWGGRGDKGTADWSIGCQIITGKAYINHHNKLIDCTPFAAPNYSTLNTKVGGVLQTKGAYSVLGDLVGALSGAKPADNNVHCTLIDERDLALKPELGADKAQHILAQFKA
jgi:peptidoglycan hydrolase-like protein with peptidoglycan-binding domain